MPAYNIKGITVEIGGDTKNFNTALDELNRKVNSSATEIGKLNRLLKLNPSNTVLLTQKQELLTKEIAASKDKSKGYIPPYGLETLRNYYDPYVALGDGDPSIKHIVETCESLPVHSGETEVNT